MRRRAVIVALSLLATAVALTAVGLAALGDGATRHVASRPQAGRPAVAEPTPTTVAAPARPPAPLPARTGRALLIRALADALSAGTAHVVTSSVLPTASGGRGSSVQDAGRTGGRQRFTQGAVTIRVLVDGTTTWVRGSADALEGLAEQPSDVAVRLAGRWVELRSGDLGYATVTAGVTLPSVLTSIPVGRQVRGVDAVLGGRTLVRLSATLTSAEGGGTETVWVTRGVRPLPVEAVVASGGSRTVTTFSDWGRAVVVSPPPDAVPLPRPPSEITVVDLVHASRTPTTAPATPRRG